MEMESEEAAAVRERDNLIAGSSTRPKNDSHKSQSLENCHRGHQTVMLEVNVS